MHQEVVTISIYIESAVSFILNFFLFTQFFALYISAISRGVFIKLLFHENILRKYIYSFLLVIKCQKKNKNFINNILPFLQFLFLLKY